MVLPHCASCRRAVGPEGEFRDHEGRPGPFSWWSEKSQARFRNATRCLGLPDSEELWRAAVSVRVSWDIFSLLRRADDGSALFKVGLPFENDVSRLFFVAYCFFLSDTCVVCCARNLHCQLSIEVTLGFDIVRSQSNGEHMAFQRCRRDRVSLVIITASH